MLPVLRPSHFTRRWVILASLLLAAGGAVALIVVRSRAWPARLYVPDGSILGHGSSCAFREPGEEPWAFRFERDGWSHVSTVHRAPPWIMNGWGAGTPLEGVFLWATTEDRLRSADYVPTGQTVMVNAERWRVIERRNQDP